MKPNLPNGKNANEVVDYFRFKRLRDEYRAHREDRIPRALSSMVVGPTGDTLYKHTALREPRDVLWIPDEFQTPGAIDQYRRKAMGSALFVRFVLTIPDELRILPVSLCAGVDEVVEVERAADTCGTVTALELCRVPAGSRYWVGLRIDGLIPEDRRREVRAMILSVGTQAR